MDSLIDSNSKDLKKVKIEIEEFYVAEKIKR
jgi:hypothetical protein